MSQQRSRSVRSQKRPVAKCAVAKRAVARSDRSQSGRSRSGWLQSGLSRSVRSQACAHTAAQQEASRREHSRGTATDGPVIQGPRPRACRTVPQHASRMANKDGKRCAPFCSSANPSSAQRSLLARDFVTVTEIRLETSIIRQCVPLRVPYRSRHP